MIIKNIKNVETLMDTIGQCKGRVELVTDEGDRLNLKSKLSQFVVMADYFNESTLKDVELIVEDPEDGRLLVNLMINGAAARK